MRLSSVLFILFTLFCPSEVISTILSSFSPSFSLFNKNTQEDSTQLRTKWDEGSSWKEMHSWWWLVLSHGLTGPQAAPRAKGPRHSCRPSWKGPGPIWPQPAQHQLGTADPPVPRKQPHKGKHIPVEAPSCLQDARVPTALRGAGGGRGLQSPVPEPQRPGGGRAAALGGLGIPRTRGPGQPLVPRVLRDPGRSPARLDTDCRHSCPGAEGDAALLGFRVLLRPWLLPRPSKPVTGTRPDNRGTPGVPE